MNTYIRYVTEVLISNDDDEYEFKIFVNRDEDIFQIFINDKQICFGDWTNNLLDMFRIIVFTERALAKIEVVE